MPETPAPHRGIPSGGSVQRIRSRGARDHPLGLHPIAGRPRSPIRGPHGRRTPRTSRGRAEPDQAPRVDAVADASPLIHLSHVGLLHLLPAAFPTVGIPPAVASEIAAEPALAGWRAFPWLLELDAPSTAMVETLRRARAGLHAGEAEAVASAAEQSCPLIVDERLATRDQSSWGPRWRPRPKPFTAISRAATSDHGRASSGRRLRIPSETRRARRSASCASPTDGSSSSPG